MAVNVDVKEPSGRAEPEEDSPQLRSLRGIGLITATSRESSAVPGKESGLVAEKMPVSGPLFSPAEVLTMAVDVVEKGSHA